MERVLENIGIFGSGRVAAVLANKLAGAGHAITIGTRDPVQAAAKWSGAHVEFRNHAEAARAAAIVINATPGETSVERLGALRDELTRKILIDVSNATLRGPNGLPGNLLYPNDGGGARARRAAHRHRAGRGSGRFAYHFLQKILAEPRIPLLQGGVLHESRVTLTAWCVQTSPYPKAMVARQRK